MRHEDAIRLAIDRMSRRLAPQEAASQLREYEDFAANASDEVTRSAFERYAEDLREWMQSDEYVDGTYPRGIDEDFVDLVEWRSLAYAFEAMPESEALAKTHLYRTWQAGATYSVFSLLGKLTQSGKHNNSLVRLWQDVYSSMREAEPFDQEELRALKTQLVGHLSRFKQSRAVGVRNAAVAHNVAQPRIGWAEVDQDLALIARAWALLVVWSNGRILFPFTESHAAFSGLEPLVEPVTLRELMRRHREYVDRVGTWCTTNVRTGERDTMNPFASVNVTISAQ